jgi:hypothetical protein
MNLILIYPDNSLLVAANHAIFLSYHRPFLLAEEMSDCPYFLGPLPVSNDKHPAQKISQIKFFFSLFATSL